MGCRLQIIVQEGRVGLLEAAARFTPERDVRFSTLRNLVEFAHQSKTMSCAIGEGRLFAAAPAGAKKRFSLICGAFGPN